MSEEQLVLYHYGEPIDRAAIEQHLESCGGCRSSYQALQEVLAAVDLLPVPEPAENYESAVWNRIERRLRRRPHFDWSSLLAWPRWAAAGGMAMLLVAAFFLGRFWPRPPATPTVANAGKVRERVLLVAVGDHLERSQMVLVELVNAKGTGPVDISSEQERAENLIEENRLYRQTAASIGETALASVLDDLERVLLEIAHSPANISQVELETIRQRLEAEGILFKIRVVGSKVQARERQTAGRERL